MKFVFCERTGLQYIERADFESFHDLTSSLPAAINFRSEIPPSETVNPNASSPLFQNDLWQFDEVELK
jgi:hypothetical protein